MVDTDINVNISESTPINVTISESTPINVTIDSVIGSSSFIGLVDTPNDYVGSALKYFRVNSSANAIEFVNDSDIEITWGNIVGDISNQNDLQSALDLKYNSSSFNSDFDTMFGTKTTTDLNEGINLYYTQSRFDNAFGLKTTDNLSEGSTNLYDKTVSLTAGTGISVSGTYPNFTITNTGEANSFIAGNGIDIVESPDDTFTFSVDESDLSLSNFGEKSHTSLTDIGNNTHAQIDSHISDSSIHFSDLSGFTTDDLTDTADNRFTNDTDIARLANTSGTNTGDSSGHSGLVPYTGASTNVDLGDKSLTASGFMFDSETGWYYDSVNSKINMSLFKGSVGVFGYDYFDIYDAGGGANNFERRLESNYIFGEGYPTINPIRTGFNIGPENYYHYFLMNNISLRSDTGLNVFGATIDSSGNIAGTNLSGTNTGDSSGHENLATLTNLADKASIKVTKTFSRIWNTGEHAYVKSKQVFLANEDFVRVYKDDVLMTYTTDWIFNSTSGKKIGAVIDLTDGVLINSPVNGSVYRVEFDEYVIPFSPTIVLCRDDGMRLSPGLIKNRIAGGDGPNGLITGIVDDDEPAYTYTATYANPAPSFTITYYYPNRAFVGDYAFNKALPTNWRIELYKQGRWWATKRKSAVGSYNTTMNSVLSPRRTFTTNIIN